MSRTRGLYSDRSDPEQTRFLDYCIQHKLTVHLFSRHGKKVEGVIHAYDQNTILFGSRDPSKARILYKCSISMVRAAELITWRTPINRRAPAGRHMAKLLRVIRKRPIIPA